MTTKYRAHDHKVLTDGSIHDRSGSVQIRHRFRPPNSGAAGQGFCVKCSRSEGDTIHMVASTNDDFDGDYGDGRE